MKLSGSALVCKARHCARSSLSMIYGTSSSSQCRYSWGSAFSALSTKAPDADRGATQPAKDTRRKRAKRPERNKRALLETAPAKLVRWSGKRLEEEDRWSPSSSVEDSIIG